MKEIMKINEHLNDVSKHLINIIHEIDQLQTENAQLKSEHYKDGEIQKLKKEVDMLFKQCCHYGLHESSWAKLHSKWDEHVAEHPEHKGRYHYEIYQFPEVDVFTIKCEKCNWHENVYF